MTRIIDTHCHPFLNKEKEPQSIIEGFFNNSGEALIIIGTDLDFYKNEIKNYLEFENVYFSLGIHPNHLEGLTLNSAITDLESQLINLKDKVVGIGECGLDYYWLLKDNNFDTISQEEKIKLIEDKRNLQKDFFKAQINLAIKYDLPVIIHNRDARDDIYEILKETGLKKFVFHCYSEDLEYAQKLLKISPFCMISFSGIVTFKNAKEVQETAKNIPIENILAETDSPYLTPTPFRGKEENEPLYTKFVIEKIAELRGEDLEYVSNEILNNSKKFFRIK